MGDSTNAATVDMSQARKSTACLTKKKNKKKVNSHAPGSDKTHHIQITSCFSSSSTLGEYSQKKKHPNFCAQMRKKAPLALVHKHEISTKLTRLLNRGRRKNPAAACRGVSVVSYSHSFAKVHPEPAVGLNICMFHNSCRTASGLTICCSLVLMVTCDSPLHSFTCYAQRPGPAASTRVPNIDCPDHLHELVIQVLPFRSLTPVRMAWQTARQSLSTSGGPHLPASTVAVFMWERRSANSSTPSRTAASGKSSLLNLGPTTRSASECFSKSPILTASWLSTSMNPPHLIHDFFFFSRRQ